MEQPLAASSERLADIRVGDLEREAAVTSLRRHTAEGRLDLVEFEQRMTNAYDAKTQTKLDLLLADLPAAPGTGLRPASRRPARWRGVSTALRAGATGIAVLGMLGGHWTPNQAPQLACLFGVLLMTRSRVVLVIAMLATLGGQTTAQANPAAPIVFLAVVAALTWPRQHPWLKRATG